ncbi:hypothetical protein ACP70R_032227 [Stipagrostis hirtigluma subsp. patula]
MDVHADVRRPAHEAALRAVQKPPAKPWRGGSATATGMGTGAPPPPPPKVYRVEPREFRDLVQRLTGAPAAARGAARQQQHHHHMTSAQPQQPVAVRAGAGEDQHHQQQHLYAAAPWLSFPVSALDAHQQHQHGNGALL